MLGGRMVWVGMSRGRFVGGRNVKAPVAFSDWLKDLKEEPVLGRQQELPRAIEEALVECHVMCSEFQYP